MDRTPMTEEGLEALRAEIAELEGPGRRDMAEQIKTARDWGDLKENAEYHAAKEAQAHLETKIAKLRDRESAAEVVEVTEDDDAVRFGSRVEVEDEKSGKKVTYELVSSRDASPAEGKLSFESPMADALRGKQPGETAEVRTPGGKRRFKVLDVS